MKHVTTDPACRYHRPPTGWLTRLRFDRARGRSCQACMVRRQLERAFGETVATFRGDLTDYVPRHGRGVGKHRAMTYRRDWMPVWAIVAPLLGFLIVDGAVVAVMVLA